jgi:hypothetical protein
MNIHKMISELQAEKQRLDDAIGALERLSAGNKSKRRPKREPSDARESLTDTDVPHSSTH